MCQLSNKFCGNLPISFCIFLLTNKKTNADENTTSLAEVIKLRQIHVLLQKKLYLGISDIDVD